MIAKKNFFSRDQKTLKLATRGQRSAFNNEENPFHIASYNRP